MIPLTATAHTRPELDTWLEEWTVRADDALSPGLIDELTDMQARHPRWGVPLPTRTTTRGKGPGVEAWAGLVAVYFNASDVDHALCIIAHESKGNPDAKNPRSTAAGLFQFLRSTWDRVPTSITGGSYDSGRVYNPEASTAAAAWLVYEGGGWRHWTVNPLC